MLDARDFGVLADGSADDTDAYNAAFEAGFLSGQAVSTPPGVSMLREATPGCGYMLLSKGVSIIGECTTFAPLPSVPTTTDFIRWRPESGVGGAEFREISGFLIHPGRDGTKRGKRGLHVFIDQQCNVNKLDISRVYCAPGNDWSIRWENHPILNAQGCPSNSLIADCALWEGVCITNAGDSNVIARNIIRSSSSTRAGVSLFLIAGALGTAGKTRIESNNIDAMGGAVFVQNGRLVEVMGNNIEQSAGSGSANGAVIDLDGASGTIAAAAVTDNHVGIFGTAAAQRGIRVNNVADAAVDRNQLATDVARTAAIQLTSLALRPVLGVNPTTGPWTSAVLNASTTGKKVQTVAL